MGKSPSPFLASTSLQPPNDFPPPCPYPCWEHERQPGQPCEAELHQCPVARGAHYQFYCAACRCYRRAPGAPTWIARHLLGATAEQLAALPVIPRQHKECPICKRTELLETHHLAPRAIFGAEAGAWPTVDVCGDCHMRWHRCMDGYRSPAHGGRHG